MTLAAQISAIFEREQHDAKVTRAAEVPASYDSITAEWLTDVLCRDVPGAVVVSHRYDQRDDGSSNRRRIFLTYNEAGIRAGLPATVFCKAAESLQTRLVLGVSGAAQAEANFYNLIRPRLDMEAPTGLHACYDPESYASLMLRDIGDDVEFCDDRTHIDFELAKTQMTTLAKLHSRFYRSDELGSPTLPVTRWDRWWRNMMAVVPDWETSVDAAFVQSEPLMSPALFRRRAEIWPATEAAAMRLGELPQALIHSDVHLKNWYITRRRVMGLSDWQNVSQGHWSRDVIYALTTALTIENRRAWEQELIRFYIDQMAEFGVPPIPLDEAWGYLRQQLLSGLTFWTITLRPAAGMPDMQPERTTLEFLRRFYAAIEDHNALDSF